eukprot:c20591_g1_i1 orf=1159-5868(-)
MKRNTPLDYAEFLLTHTRTRCELHIISNGVREKLASGYLKPFLTHLQAAEAQAAKGNQVIKLERPSNFLKKNKVTWFTKGTLERFVRFVSTPEVLERVKSIEDELSQLEHVRIALSKTFSQSEAPFHTMDDTNSSAGVYQMKGGISMMRQRSSKGADDNGADASKIELLRAMDVRLVALKQEQSAAFSRATAAGFDNSNMADLLDFSEHFGAERLREACIQYITLFRKRNIPQVSPEELGSPSADGASSGSDMSLESGTNMELVAETEADSPVDGEEAWPKALKSYVPDDAEKLSGWDPKPGLKDERTISASSASVRTRSRWGPPERIQMSCLDPEVGGLQDSKGLRKVGEVRHQGGNYTHQDDSRHCESGMKTFQGDGEFHSTVRLKKQFSLPKISSPHDLSDSTSSSLKGRKQQGDKEGDSINKGGMFFTRLQKMAQQVEARRSGEDLGVHFTSVDMSDESPGSQSSAFGNSSSLSGSVLNPSDGTPSYTVADDGFPQPQSQESKLVSGHPPPGAISPMLQETSKVGGQSLGNSNSIVDSVPDHPTIRDGFKNGKDNLEKSGEMHVTKSESSKVKDSQEESVSSSARRLSVQAAISLFESKKSNVGEPPTRKLVRQDSLKGAVQSETSTSEKSVLRRWSGIGNESPRDVQVIAPDMGGNEPRKVVEIEHVTQKDETMVRNDSLRIDKLAQSQTDKTKASQLLRNTFPHLSSAQQSAPDADAASPKHRLSVEQQSLGGDSSISSGEMLQKQFKQELEKRLTRSAQTSVGVDAALPHKSVTGSSKTSDVTIKRHQTDPKPETKEKVRASVNSMVLEMRRDPGNEEKQNSTTQNMTFLLGNLAVTETAPKKLPSLKEDKADHLSVEKLKISKTKQETDKNIPTESKLSYGTSAQPTKEPSLILHDTPVDLYMQALVMMIDNHNQSSHSLGDEESCKDQRGRFYEHYWRLRNVRQREEPPAKRAEREAKLKSMKETLEKRKAEMEAGVLRQAKKNSHLVNKEQKGIAKHRVQKSGPLVTPGEMEELGGEEVGLQDQLLYAPSHGFKHHVLKSRAQVSKKTAPNLQKSASAPRSIMTTPSMSSPRTIPQNPTGTRTIINQRKLTASSYSGTLESPIHKTVPVDFRRDTSKFSLVRTTASVKSQDKINGCSQSINPAVAAVVESNYKAEAETEINKMGEAEAEASYAQALNQIVLESFKGHQDVGSDRFMNGISSVAQDVKPFLHQGHALLPGQGNGIVNHDSRHSLERYDKEAFLGPNSCEDISTIFLGREDTGDFDLRKSLESDNSDCAVNPVGVMHSSSSDKCRSNDDGSHFVNSKSPDSLNVDEAGYIFEDASNDERILLIDEEDQEKHESNLSRDQMHARFNEGDTVYEKESSAITSAEKMVEYSQSDSNSSASVHQECTTSTYSDAAASPANSFEGNFGTVLGAYSPKPAMLSDSPSGSPVSWKSLKTNHPSEHDLSRSQRQYSVSQKLVSITSQSNKEPARGFKRLLHFGRKSRASEAVSIDGISASTTSEGDDETEEVKELMRQSSDEISQRTKLHEKGPSLVSNKGHYSFQDQGATVVEVFLFI